MGNNRCLLQINSVANTGSTGRIAEQIGNKAIADGWRSIIAYGRYASPSQSELYRIGNKASIYTHALSSILLDNHGLMSTRSTGSLIDHIERLKPDVVQIHNLHGYYINFRNILLYLKRKNIPIVITLHDFWLMTGHCAYINDCCSKWKTGCYHCPRHKSYPSSLIDRSQRNWSLKTNIFERADNITFIPVSHWLDNKVAHSILRNCKRSVIQNGIDLHQFYIDRSECSIVPENKFVILCVATRWTESNGFNDIIELSKIIDSNTVIIIIGIDKKQKATLPDNIIGIERTESISVLRKIYSCSDILFNPNKEVTFGLVTAEAMACGTPAIVMKDSAGEEVVGKYGYVIDSYTAIPDIIKNISRQCNNNQSELYRKYIQENFELDNQLSKYMDLYNSII